MFLSTYCIFVIKTIENVWVFLWKILSYFILIKNNIHVLINTFSQVEWFNNYRLQNRIFIFAQYSIYLIWFISRLCIGWLRIGWGWLIPFLSTQIHQVQKMLSIILLAAMCTIQSNGYLFKTNCQNQHTNNWTLLLCLKRKTEIDYQCLPFFPDFVI